MGTHPAMLPGIAIGHDGSVYSLGRVTEQGKTRADLFCVKGPFTP